jgi:hypothetical protein
MLVLNHQPLWVYEAIHHPKEKKKKKSFGILLTLDTKQTRPANMDQGKDSPIGSNRSPSVLSVGTRGVEPPVVLPRRIPSNQSRHVLTLVTHEKRYQLFQTPENTILHREVAVQCKPSGTRPGEWSANGHYSAKREAG